MANLCSQCDRTISPDSIQAGAAFCPFCGWQQEQDAMPTAGAESPSADTPEPPVEEVSFTLGQSLVRFAWSSLLISTIMAFVITLIFILFAICIAVLGGGIPFGRIVAGLPLFAWFFGCSWCFCAVVSVPLTLYWSLTSRHRRMWVEGGRLHMKIGRSQDSWDLKECFWCETQGLGGDSRGYYFGDVQPRLAVVNRKTVCGLGFSAATARHWVSYFETAAVYRPPRIDWRKRVASIAIVLGLGGLIGYTIGLLVFLCGAPVGIEGFLAFIGCLDGVMAAGCGSMCRNERQFGKASRTSVALLMAVAYACVAVKVVFTAWQIILLNAAIGAVIGWFIVPDRRADKSDNEGFGDVAGSP